MSSTREIPAIIVIMSNSQSRMTLHNVSFLEVDFERSM